MTQLRKRIRVSDYIKEVNASRTTTYRHIGNGLLPKPHKIGNIPYFYVDELEAALSGARLHYGDAS